MSSNQRTSDATSVAVLAAVRSGSSNREAAALHGIDEATVRRIRQRHATSSLEIPGVTYYDKKVSTLNWRDTIPLVQKMQEMKESSSRYQNSAKIRIGDGKSPVALVFFSDQHLGALGADYELFLQMTDLILNIPNLFVVLGGDEIELAIRGRSVMETCAQVVDPEVQEEFLEQWLNEIKHKVVLSTWSNHSTSRQLELAGASSIAKVLAKEVVFFDGLGHAEIQVGTQTYLAAISHKFKGANSADPARGIKNYLKTEWPLADFGMQGDIHKAKIEVYEESGRTKAALVSGSLHTNSRYAKTGFSLKSSTAFPVMVLRHDVKSFTPFFTIQDWLSVYNDGVR